MATGDASPLDLRSSLEDLEARVQAGDRLAAADIDRVRDCPDLIAVGLLGEADRRRRHGHRVTWLRVLALPGGNMPAGMPSPEPVAAGEYRITGPADGLDEFRHQVRAARSVAGDRPCVGGALDVLAEWCGDDPDRVVKAAAALRGDGLDALASAPLDRLGTFERARDLVEAASRGGVAVWRLSIDRGTFDQRLPLLDLAERLQQTLGTFRTLAPLPRLDPPEEPSTGYDDVRTIVLARLIAASIPSIQVDWSLYGPKLAQVALTYGADDIDNVPALDSLGLGWRRSPAEDIARQIRAAFAEPVERDGRFTVPS